MSVIRQPGVFGRHTRRRLVGVTAAFVAAALEAAAVGLWFTLVVIESRTASTALAGLGILFCGALLRVGVFGATTTAIRSLLTPRRVGVTLVLVGSWISWLFVAEWIGGVPGLLAAGSLLTTALSAQFVLERRVFRFHENRQCHVMALYSALLASIGATTLLASVWFTDWAVTTDPITVGSSSVFLSVEAFQIGLVVFGVFVFLSQQRRFQYTLEP